MKVIGDKILVKVVKEESTMKTASGLSIPAGTKNPGIEKAEIIAVGDGENVSGKLNPGDKIFIHQGYGSEFTCPTDNEKYRSMDPSGIIVILD